MGASSKEFTRQREMEDYDDMPTYREVMASSDPTPRERILKVNKLRDTVAEIEQKINTLKVLATSDVFKDNPHGVAYSVCVEMINSPDTPYFYVSMLVKSEYIKRPGYHGESYENKVCVKNPIFDWKGEEGKKLQMKERKFYEYE